MMGTHEERHGCGGGAGGNDFGSVGVGVERVRENGSALDTETSSSGLEGGYGLRTYKRRKNGKVAEDGKIGDDSVSQPCEKKGSYAPDMSSNEYSLKQQRNIILDQIFQSLDSEGGLKKCIENALVSHPGTGSRTTIKESVHSCKNSKCTSQTEVHDDGIPSTTRVNLGMTSTELFQCTFSDIIMSEKFAQLCSLLLENFQGMQAHKLFDLNCINTRMKEQVYENSPFLFQSDIQQVWTKLQKIGADITALAKCLSDKTKTSFREKLGNSANSLSENGKPEFHAQDSDMDTKSEQTETCTPIESLTCSHCREKADGRTCLICDSCEEMYHISCIEPPVKDIPARSWYCTNCTAKGIGSPHENCIACERLNSSKSSLDANGQDETGHDATADELDESSNKGKRRFPDCKICRTEVRNEEEYIICGHSFCPHNFYHMKCLTAKQLLSHGSCWYCPSCLCRSCLTDQDDDKIVLCDGCDHAYHIYCMQPPRSTVPKGKWFCQKCDGAIQRVRKARRTYENKKNMCTQRALDGKLKGNECFNKAGGVDMLLNAARTLNHEENTAAMGGY